MTNSTTRTARNVILGLVAAASLAAPAFAHTQGPTGPAPQHGHVDHNSADGRGAQDIDVRQERIADRIARGIQTRQLSAREAERLRIELSQIRHVEYRYRYRGLSRSEFEDLSQRLTRLERDMARQLHDDDRRYGYGYGYGHAGHGYGDHDDDRGREWSHVSGR